MTTKTKTTTKKVKAPKKTTVKTIWEALFNFQCENIDVPKTGKGIDRDGNEYEHHVLEDVIHTIRPYMTKHRIAYSQVIDGENLITTLVAIDAAPEDNKLSSSVELGTPSTTQEFGARVTVIRRYALLALLGLSGEEDTDNGEKPKVQNVPKKTVEVLTPRNEADPTIPDPSWTDAHRKAFDAIKACKNHEAMQLLAGRVEESTKLDASEKKSLRQFINERAF